MNDVQNYIDNRNITVDQVGIWDIEYPIVVKDRENEIQHTVAKTDITVMLLPEFKGTHMSRIAFLCSCRVRPSRIFISSMSSAVYPAISDRPMTTGVFR